MFAYKYIKKKYLLEFIENGSILINTLHNLWAEHEAIRDNFEGRQQLKVVAESEPLSYSGKEFHRLFPEIKSDKPNIVIQLEKGTSITDNKMVSNAFVFCLSLEFDDALMQKFGYDAYYKITDLARFAKILYERINEVRILRCYKADKVRYSDKQIVVSSRQESLSRDFNDFWDICFTKPRKFRNEREYRIVFVPEYSTEIKPLILSCPELRKYCEF
jgi:hypothetical protein